MSAGNVVIRFDEVSFHYSVNKPILEEVSFSVRTDTKITIMGQNGAGKSTLFKLLTGELKPEEGRISIDGGASVAIATQVMKRENMDKTVEEFFAQAFDEKKYDLPKRIKQVLEVVQLVAPLDKVVKDFSGGQQARLLLAYALIQEPDVLLLDEPTNNLDAAGIDHLTSFLVMYPKTCIVISHDADFLNAFTDGVLYLDSHTHKVEQYVGNYFDVLEEIEARIERERAKNAQLQKSIQDRKDKINFFAHKGGKMRKLASKLRDQVEEAEENMVEERQEDKTIRSFTIPSQEAIPGVQLVIDSIRVIRDHQPEQKTLTSPLELRKKEVLVIAGHNGIGKSTFLRALASGDVEGARITPGVKVGYYQQDFSGLDFDKTGYEALASVMESPDKQTIYETAAQFLLAGDVLHNKVGSMSEGQKGLLCYAQFVLMKPGLLIMDEPTNHINFRHLPVIAEALDNFAGAVVMVSHAPDFLNQIKIERTLDLNAL